MTGWLELKDEYSVKAGDKYVAIIKVDDETLTYKLTLSRQTDVVGYALFINHFAPALVGVQTWQSKRGKDDLIKS